MGRELDSPAGGGEMARSITPRDRIKATLEHREPDIVPFDLGGTKVTSICKRAYLDLVGALGLEVAPLKIVDQVQQLPELDPRLLQAVDACCIGIAPRPPSRWQLRIFQDGEYQVFYDEWGSRLQMPLSGGYYFDRVEAPIKEHTMEALKAYDWPDPGDPARYAGLREEALQLREATGYALVGSCPLGTDLTSRLLWLRGYTEGMMDLLDNPTFVEALLDRVTEIAIRAWDLFLSEVGDCVDVVVMSDDLGTQRAPLFSPAVYSRFFKPRLAQIVSFVKHRSQAKIFFHSDGAMYQFIPDLIEMGVDILNPVQVSAAGMGDTAKLKREFGKELTFWGAIDTQSVLPFGQPEDVRQEVRRRLEDLAPGGGYVLAAVHNIQDGVAPQNVLAMVQALHE